MTSTKMIKAVNDEALEAVAGGNYGDMGNVYIELDYTEGMAVEIFDNFWHTTTTRAIITSVKQFWGENYKYNPYTGEFDCEHYFKYYCEFIEQKYQYKNGWYTADDIER